VGCVGFCYLIVGYQTASVCEVQPVVRNLFYKPVPILLRNGPMVLCVLASKARGKALPGRQGVFQCQCQCFGVWGACGAAIL